MAQYHVTDDGRVLPCSANIKKCSFRNAADGNRHFSDPEEAQKKATELLLMTYDQFNSVSKKSSETLSPRVRRRSKNSSLHLGHSMNLNNSLEDSCFDKVPSVVDNKHFKDFTKTLS